LNRTLNNGVDIMARLLPLEGLLMNLKQEIPETRRREYLTKEQAYESLRKLTGKDFDYRIADWEEYLSSIDYDLTKISK
jgi:predicted solute-binding protein